MGISDWFSGLLRIIGFVKSNSLLESEDSGPHVAWLQPELAKGATLVTASSKMRHETLIFALWS